MEIFMAPHLAGRTAAGLHLVYYESDPILKNKGEFKLETSTNFTSAEWQYTNFVCHYTLHVVEVLVCYLA